MSLAESSPAPPTRARFVVAAWLCSLSAILYIDRICFSQFVEPMKTDLGLSKTQISYVMMAFTFAYGLFATPVGRFGDRMGSRTVLTRIVLGWSMFTALTGAASGLLSLILIRFLFGVAEAGAFPNAARVISRWFPLEERGRVQGVMLSCTQLGAVVAPPIAAYLIEGFGWRWGFPVFGLIGIAWAAWFWFWFRDDPANHPKVNHEELAQIHASALVQPIEPRPVPWRAVFVNRGIILLTVVIALGAFYTYFFYSWFPTYLMEARGLSNVESGWMNSLVLAGSAVGMFIGGWLADRIPIWSNDVIRARCLLGAICNLAAALCVLAGSLCENALSLGVLWCIGFAIYHLTLPSWWSAVIQQSGRHVGALFGFMNGFGSVGSLLSQGFVGVFTDWRGSQGYTGRAQWDPMFNVYVGVLVLCAISWWLYRLTPLEEAEEPKKE